MSQYSKLTNIFVKQNSIELSDTHLKQFLPPNEDTYFQVENSRELFQTIDYKKTLASVYFRFDTKFDNFQREIYSISDLLEDVGGFQSSIIFLGALLVGIFSERLFYGSLIEKIY